MSKLKAPVASSKLEAMVKEINESHVDFIGMYRSNMWEIAHRLKSLRDIVTKNELIWAEWRAKLVISESMVSRYLSLAEYYPKRLVAPKAEKGEKLQVLSIEDFVKAGKEAQKDGVSAESKVIEMQTLKEAKAAVTGAKKRKAEATQKLAKIKKELEGKGPVRSTAERQAAAKEAEELEQEIEEIDPEVQAAEAELAKVETKRRNAMDPQDFFEALALVGITHARGKWVLEDYAAMAFGFIYASGIATGAVEKKVWEPLFTRIADVHKRNKAPKIEQQRLEACLKFFQS